MNEPISPDEADDRKSRFEVLLALALDDAPVPPRPSDADIAAWYDGKLEGDQAEHVHAWMARSPEGYALWSSLPPPAAAPVVTVNETAKVIELPVAARRRSNARKAAFTLVPAALAATVLLSVLPRHAPSLDEQLDSLAANLSMPAGLAPPLAQKALISPAIDADRAAYAAGVRSVLQGLTGEQPAWQAWQAWLAKLPKESLAVCGQDATPACNERLALLRSAGRLSALAIIACQSTPPADQTRSTSLLASADELAKKLQALHPSGFAASVATGLQAGTKDLSSLCSTAGKQIGSLP